MKTLLTPPKLAVMVTAVGAATGRVWIAIVPVALPVATAIPAGTVAAAGFELVNATVPPVNAAPERVNPILTICPPAAVPE